MKAVITIHIESSEAEAQQALSDFIAALETLLLWQWDNVAIGSAVTIGNE